MIYDIYRVKININIYVLNFIIKKLINLDVNYETNLFLLLNS